jgi:type II secretory pathway component PulM
MKDKLLDGFAWVILVGIFLAIMWAVWLGRHEGSLIAVGAVILVAGFFWALYRVACRKDRLQEESYRKNVIRMWDNNREEARRVVEAHKKGGW